MSSTSLGADLDLRVDRALRGIARLDSALSAAASRFDSAISDAVSGVASARVDLDVDTGDLDEAVGRVQRLGGTETVDVDVSGADLDEAASDAERLADGFEDAQGEAARLGDEVDGLADRSVRLGTALKAAFAFVGARETIRFIRDTVDAASDLTEASSKAGVVFGDAFEQVDRAAQDSAQAAGLAQDAFFDASGSLGQLFVSAAGLARSEAAEMSTTILQLSADVASFNNLQIDEALTALRAGLVGEIEPLRRIGVAFNAAQVEAEAMRLGLVGAGEELDESAKIVARYNLILQQTDIIQGDFARTSGFLANQQRTLAAEFRNAQAEIGEALLPAALELVTALREDGIPALEQFGEALGPLLVQALETGLPLLSTLADIIVALTPAINLTADALDRIPDSILSAALAVGILSRALKGLGLAGLAAGLGGVASSAPAAAGGLAGFATAAGRLGRVFGLGVLVAGVSSLAGVIGDLTGTTNDLEDLNVAMHDLVVRGLPTQQLDDAVGGLEGIARAIDDVVDPSAVENFGAGVSRAVDAVGQALTLGFLPVRGTAVQLTEELAAVDEQLARLAESGNAEAVAQTIADIGEQGGHSAEVLERAFPKATEAIEDAERATSDVDGTMTEAEQAAAALSGELGLLGDEALDAGQGVSSLSDRLDALIGVQVSVQQAQLRLFDGFQRLGEGFAETDEAGRRLPATFDAATQRGQELRGLALALVNDIGAFAQAQEDAGVASEQVAATMQLNVAALSRFLAQQGLAEAEVREFINTLNLTPNQISTVFEVDTSRATQQVNTFFRNLTQSVARALPQAGIDVSGGLALGIEGGTGGAVAAAIDMARRVIGATADELGTRSPSTLTRRMGVDLDAGLVEGIEAGTGQAVAAADTLADALATGSLSNLPDVFGGVGRDAATAFVEAMEAERPLIERVVDDMFSGVVEGASNILSGIGAQLGTVRATGRLRTAEAELEAAEARLEALQEEQATLPGRLAAIRAEADALQQRVVTADPAVLRARSDLAEAEQRLARARQAGDVQATLRAESDLAAATIAEQEATEEAIESSERLTELRDEEEELSERVAEISDDLTEAKRDVAAADDAITDAALGAVEAQLRLVEAGRSLIGQGPQAEALFRELAGAAGLTTVQVDRLGGAYRDVLAVSRDVEQAQQILADAAGPAVARAEAAARAAEAAASATGSLSDVLNPAAGFIRDLAAQHAALNPLLARAIDLEQKRAAALAAVARGERALGFTPTFQAAEGAVFPARPGGHLVRLGEAGQAETVLPHQRAARSVELLVASGLADTVDVDGTRVAVVAERGRQDALSRLGEALSRPTLVDVRAASAPPAASPVPVVAQPVAVHADVEAGGQPPRGGGPLIGQIGPIITSDPQKTARQTVREVRERAYLSGFGFEPFGGR